AEAPESLGVLEGARAATPRDRVGRQPQQILAEQPHAAGRGPLEPRDDVEDGGFPGAIRADHREAPPLRDPHGHAPQRGEPAEADREVLDAEHRYSPLSQSVTGLNRPFSTRTQNPCFCVSWSGPIVSGGRIPLSHPLIPSSAAMSDSRVRFVPARFAASAKSIPAKAPAIEQRFGSFCGGSVCSCSR